MSEETKSIAEALRGQAAKNAGIEASLIEQSTELARSNTKLLKLANAVAALDDDPKPPPKDGDDLFLAIPERLWTIDHRSEVELDDRDHVIAIKDPYTGELVASGPPPSLPNKIPVSLPRLDQNPFRVRGYGGWLEGPSADGLRTLVVVALSTAQPGRFAKLLGADAETSERGGLCLGRTKGGEIEAWADDGVQFAAARAPLAEGRPVLYVVRLEENRLRLYCDGHHRTVEYAEALKPLTGPLVFLAGWWQHQVVDPANALLYAAHGFAEAISDADLEKVVEHYREMAPPKPEEPSDDNGGNGGNGNGGNHHGDEVPHPGGPTVDIDPENAAARTRDAPHNADIVARRGDYDGRRLTFKNGQRWRAPDGAKINGHGARFLVNATGSAALKEVALIGFEVTNFDASPKGLNEKSRMRDETGVIHLEHDICPDWIMRDMIFRRLGKAAVRISARIDMRRILLEDVEGAPISGHTYDAVFEEITGRRINQKVRAHTHHHSGLIKLTGGQQRDHNGPARQNIHLERIRGHEIYGRGILWVDWNVRRVTIDNFLADGCEKEGITFEAMEGGTARNGEIRNRRKKHKDPAEWNAGIMLQNARECLIERVKVFASPGLDAAFAAAHHNRHNMSGPTIGRFTGTDNLVRDCEVQHGIQHVLYQGVVDIPPGRQAVLASNKASGITRF